MKNRQGLGTVLLGSFIVVLLQGCQGATEDDSGGGNVSGKISAAVSACVKEDGDYVNATIGRRDPVDGGLLYDKWWAELGLAEPTDDHPMWASRDTGGADINTREGKDTWRCKECHGWDYKGVDGAYGSGSHFTGFAGIMDAAEKDVAEVFCSIKAEDDHSFGEQMDDDDILRLTAFITDPDGFGIEDYDQYLNADQSSKGDVTMGEALFTELTCGTPNSCHSSDGSTNAGDHGLGGIAVDNPWEFMHKIRFGQPADLAMLSLEGSNYTRDDYSDLLAYAQTLPVLGDSDGDMTPVDGDVVRGGLLYDNWAKVIEFEGATLAPELAQTNPLYLLRPLDDPQSTDQSGAGTWRCKECHGWDYKGVNGAYASGSHLSGFGGVNNAASTKSAAEIQRIITEGFKDPATGNTLHKFGDHLDPTDLAALTAFVVDGVIDMDAYISASTKIALGDTTSGSALYALDRSNLTNPGCTLCHGQNGGLIDFKGCATVGQGTQWLGDLARSNPWEVLHKTRFGQPTVTDMPSLLDLGFTDADAADIVAYSQGLAAAPGTCPP